MLHQFITFSYNTKNEEVFNGLQENYKEFMSQYGEESCSLVYHYEDGAQYACVIGHLAGGIEDVTDRVTAIFTESNVSVFNHMNHKENNLNR